MIRGYKVNNYRNKLDADVAQALAKFMVEAISLCNLEHYRARILINSGDLYEFDFSSGDAISDDEMSRKAKGGEKLKALFYEVSICDEPNLQCNLPNLQCNSLEVVFVGKEGDGVRNIALETSMYRIFAAKFFKVLDIFPTRFIRDAHYINGEKVLSM